MLDTAGRSWKSASEITNGNHCSCRQFNSIIYEVQEVVEVLRKGDEHNHWSGIRHRFVTLANRNVFNLATLIDWMGAGAYVPHTSLSSSNGCFVPKEACSIREPWTHFRHVRNHAGIDNRSRSLKCVLRQVAENKMPVVTHLVFMGSIEYQWRAYSLLENWLGIGFCVANGQVHWGWFCIPHSIEASYLGICRVYS